MSEQNNLPAPIENPINDIDFGNLINLPRIYASSLSTVNGAKAYSDPILAAVDAVDITKVDALVMEELMKPVREFRVFAAEAKTEINDARMPHTRKMDEMKGILIDLEKDLDEMGNQAATRESKWEAEKIRRQREANAEAQKKINKANERASLIAAITNQINISFANLLVAEVQDMATVYYQKTAEELPEYGEALLGWTPELEDHVYNPVIDAIKANGIYHTREELTAIVNETAGNLKPTLDAEYTSKMTGERNRLVDLIPSRINELNTVAPEVAQARIDAEQNAIKEQIVSTVQAKKEVVEMTTANEQLNAVLTHSPAAVGVPMAKGTKVKEVYKITAHTAFLPIISNWVKNHLSKLTLDEATKKLSFMITAANADLNEGTKLEAAGLETVEDVKVSKQRKSTVAA